LVFYSSTSSSVPLVQRQYHIAEEMNPQLSGAGFAFVFRQKGGV